MAATLAGGFLIRGWQMSTLAETVEGFGGSILVHHENWTENPKAEFNIDLNATTRAALNATGLLWIDRIVVPVTLQSERETRGATLLGIDVDRELLETSVQRLRIDGDFLQTEPRGIVIGQALADDLETRLGKRIVLLGQNSKNERKELGLRIVGIYHANSEAAERGVVYVSRALARTAFDLNGRTSEIALAAPNILDTSLEVSALQNALQKMPATTAPNGPSVTFPDAPPALAVRDWREVVPGIWAMYKLVEGMVGDMADRLFRRARLWPCEYSGRCGTRTHPGIWSVDGYWHAPPLDPAAGAG